MFRRRRLSPPVALATQASQEYRPATTRSPSSINIAETVIHIPNTAKVTLNETDYPTSSYKAVWDADDKENPKGDGDRIVWALPACPPNGSPGTDGLCLSFSAALLNDADWDGDIVYHLDHVHQIDIDKQDPRYVLAYHVINGQSKLHWDSSDARKSHDAGSARRVPTSHVVLHQSRHVPIPGAHHGESRAG